MTPSLPDIMRAIEVAEFGGPEKLRLCSCNIPVITEYEILIKVYASGVNRPDIIQRQGLYPSLPGARDIPGLEVAGTVAALGKSVSTFKVGDRICALLTGGGYAQYANAYQELCLPIPKNLSLTESAGIPETFFTV